MCVVETYTQSQYVPWLVCMDSGNDQTQACDTANNMSDDDMTACVTANGAANLDKYLALDAPIHQTPTVYVNGANTRTSYSAIKTAICNADSTLAGCSANSDDPIDADKEIQTFCAVEQDIVA